MSINSQEIIERARTGVSLFPSRRNRGAFNALSGRDRQVNKDWPTFPIRSRSREYILVSSPVLSAGCLLYTLESLSLSLADRSSRRWGWRSTALPDSHTLPKRFFLLSLPPQVQHTFTHTYAHTHTYTLLECAIRYLRRLTRLATKSSEQNASSLEIVPRNRDSHVSYWRPTLSLWDKTP